MLHPGLGQPADLVRQERHAADLEQVLGAVRGQRQQPAAEPAGDDDGLTVGARLVAGPARGATWRAIMPLRRPSASVPRARLRRFPAAAGRAAAPDPGPAAGDVLRRRHRRADRAVGDDVRQLGGQDRRASPRTSSTSSAAGWCWSTCPRTGSGAVWLGAAWSLGLRRHRRPRTRRARRDLVVCGPEGVRDVRRRRGPGPRGRAVAAPARRAVRRGAARAGSSTTARSCSPSRTRSSPTTRPAPTTPRWRDARGTSTRRRCSPGGRERPSSRTGGRLLTDVNPCTRGRPGHPAGAAGAPAAARCGCGTPTRRRGRDAPSRSGPPRSCAPDPPVRSAGEVEAAQAVGDQLPGAEAGRLSPAAARACRDGRPCRAGRGGRRRSRRRAATSQS